MPTYRGRDRSGFIYRIGASGSTTVYIGQTQRSPATRLWEHRRGANKLLCAFLREHEHDLSFVWWPTDDVDRSEIFHEKMHLNSGFRLLNRAPCGPARDRRWSKAA